MIMQQKYKVLFFSFSFALIFILAINSLIYFKIKLDLESLKYNDRILKLFNERIDTVDMAVKDSLLGKLIEIIENDTEYTFKKYNSFFFHLQYLINILPLINENREVIVDYSIARSLLYELSDDYKNRKYQEFLVTYKLNKNISSKEKMYYYFNFFIYEKEKGLNNLSIKYFSKKIDKLSYDELKYLIRKISPSL